MSEPSLKEKTIKGVGWSAIDKVTQYVVSFVVSIVLARLLSPDDYGLIGIVAIFTTICTSIVDGGFTVALIRKKDATEDDFNTVFILNMVVSVLLYAIIYFCAPFIALFFHRHELVSLVRVASIAVIIGSLAIVQQTHLTKRIDFKTQTKITFIASLVSAIVGIAMAFMGFGVWSLVAQNLVKYLLRTLSLWLFNRWMPTFKFSVKSAKELFDFGWKMMASNLLNDLWRELYPVIVGKFYSPASLGQYTRASDFSKLFSNNLTGVIQRVTFPTLSTIQDDRVRLINAYRKIIKSSMFLTATSMLYLGAISEPLLYCLIGPKWHDAAIYLPLICIAGSLYPLHAINLNMLSVLGRSDIFLKLEIIKKIISLIPLFVGAFVGIVPMLCVNIVTGIIGYFLNSYYSGKILNYSSFAQIKDIAPSYCIATIVALSVWFFKFLPISYWLVLPIQLVVGATVFFTVCKTTKIQEYQEAKELLIPFVNKLKKSK